MAKIEEVNEINGTNENDDKAAIMCATTGCGKAATKMQCPTCLKLDIKDVYFCSQVSLAVLK